jgi:hypothetical protein
MNCHNPNACANAKRTLVQLIYKKIAVTFPTAFRRQRWARARMLVRIVMLLSEQGVHELGNFVFDFPRHVTRLTDEQQLTLLPRSVGFVVQRNKAVFDCRSFLGIQRGHRTAECSDGVRVTKRSTGSLGKGTTPSRRKEMVLSELGTYCCINPEFEMWGCHTECNYLTERNPPTDTKLLAISAKDTLRSLSVSCPTL